MLKDLNQFCLYCLATSTASKSCVAAAKPRINTGMRSKKAVPPRTGPTTTSSRSQAITARSGISNANSSISLNKSSAGNYSSNKTLYRCFSNALPIKGNRTSLSFLLQNTLLYCSLFFFWHCVIFSNFWFEIEKYCGRVILDIVVCSV